MKIDLVINDIRVGDIYEHDLGGIYEVMEVNKTTKLFVGNKVNIDHPKDEFHSVGQIKNFYGKFK